MCQYGVTVASDVVNEEVCVIVTEERFNSCDYV